MTNTVVVIISLVAGWMVFRKMGHQGFEYCIPFYNIFIMFQELEGNGFKALYLLIPFVNIYWIFKLNIDLAEAFNKPSSFGVGLAILNPIFMSILAFSDAQYLGGVYEVDNDDFVSDFANKVAKETFKKVKDDRALEKIEKLEEMHRQGIVTDEEFEQTKAELLKRI